MGKEEREGKKWRMKKMGGGGGKGRSGCVEERKGKGGEWEWSPKRAEREREKGDQERRGERSLMHIEREINKGCETLESKVTVHFFIIFSCPIVSHDSLFKKKYNLL